MNATQAISTACVSNVLFQHAKASGCCDRGAAWTPGAGQRCTDPRSSTVAISHIFTAATQICVFAQRGNK